MHNEPEALRELQALSLNAKHHLSHILRNGLMNIISCNGRKNVGVEDAVLMLEGQIKEIGL